MLNYLILLSNEHRYVATSSYVYTILLLFLINFSQLKYLIETRYSYKSVDVIFNFLLISV